MINECVVLRKTVVVGRRSGDDQDKERQIRLPPIQTCGLISRKRVVQRWQSAATAVVSKSLQSNSHCLATSGMSILFSSQSV